MSQLKTPTTTKQSLSLLTTSSDPISNFINTIGAYTINIPIWLQITVIVIIMIAVTIGAYLCRDLFDITYLRGGFTWFIFIAILNLASILCIFVYYSSNTTSTSYVGPQGKIGKKGKRGKVGKYVTCSYCKSNLYLQTVRTNDVICTLSTFTESFKDINKKIIYFSKLISKGNINYDDFINNILLSKDISSKTKTSQESITNFKTLMKPSSIAISLVNTINKQITRASKDTYGTFQNPNGKVGFISIGDSVYGGNEEFQLNSFMINGNVMYPSSYTALVTFTSYNEKTQDTDNYTIWRPIGQNVTEKTGYKNESITYNYLPLGDICRFGTSTSPPPDVTEIATIRDDCVTPLDPKDLNLVFIYVGDLIYSDETKPLDYTQSNSYLITNRQVNDIEIFSVWRTPLNTFISNTNSQNVLVNHTLYYNIITNVYITDSKTGEQINSSLNEYGNVNSETKKRISFLLQSISIPKILSATIICKHYETELYKEIIYYFNKYQSRVPEFANAISIDNVSKSSFGTIMNLISDTIKQYDDFNLKLQKDATTYTIVTDEDGNKSNVYNKYEEDKEKHLPPQLITIYNYVNTKLLTISVQIENANTLLDIINILFDNGLESRVAVDSNGIAEGGVLLNGVQETVIRICKMLQPPPNAAYTINDECLGTFAVNHEKESEKKKLANAVTKYNKLTDEIYDTSTNKYSQVLQNVKQYRDIFDIHRGELCGHIKNYIHKIDTMNMEEFTTSRIKQLIILYNDMNSYLEGIISTTN